MQPRPPSKESLSQILYSPPPTATSASEHFAFQARHEKMQPSTYSKPLVVESVTSPISPIFKQPYPWSVPNDVQPRPVQYAPQQPFRQPIPVPTHYTPLKSTKSKQIFEYLSRPQPLSSQPQSYQPKYPSDCLQRRTSQLPPSAVLALPVLKSPASLLAPQSQQNADQLQHPYASHQLSKPPTKPSPQQLSIQSHELPPDDLDQSSQSSPQLSHQPSSQSSGSDSPHDQSPPLSPHEPISLSPPPPPPNPPPSQAQLPQQTRYTPADVLNLKTKDNFNILLFRITTYLGFLFDGLVERKHYGGRSLATYPKQKHGVTLQITDTFGPDIKEKHESSFPDLILMCLPLSSDVDIRRKENNTLLVMKRSYKNYIWHRVVIALTVPDSEKNGTAAILKRQGDIEKYMKSLSIPTIPPFICISDTPTRDMLGDPKPTWYTELWSAIFKHCSDAGFPTLHVHLTDRLTGISATTRSCLPKIPKESIKILEKRIEELQNAKDTAQANVNATAHQTKHKQPH